MDKHMGGLHIHKVVLLIALFWSVSLWAHPINALAAHGKIRADTNPCGDPEYWYMYSYGSHCSLPALYFTEGFQLYDSITWRGLQPEWDEASDTYYVRLAATSATYTLQYNRTEAPPGTEFVYVLQMFRAYLQNTESKRYLAWQQQASGQHLLIETDSFDTADFFIFSDDISRPRLPCVDIPGIRCQNYLVRSLPRENAGQFPSGLQSYPSDSGAPYITVGAPSTRGNLPIVVTRVASNSTANANAARVPATSSLIRLNT